MPGVTTKITFWVICLSYVSGLMVALGIQPDMNTSPMVNTTDFAKVGNPGDHQPDPWIGPWELIWNAATAVVGSFWKAFYVFGTIRQYGFPVEYAAAGQCIVLVLYGYDMYAIWKGYDIL